MGIVSSRRKRRALNRQLSALATGYFTNRQIHEFRNALGPDPINYKALFKFLDATALSDRLQRKIVRECSHGESEETLDFADFLNARVGLEQRYSADAIEFCKKILLTPSGQLDEPALADCVQFAAGGASACSPEAAVSVAAALVLPTKDANLTAEDAVTDIFERCPALLKLIMRMLSDAAQLPWVPPPGMHTLKSHAKTVGASPGDSSNAAPAPESAKILTPELTWLLAGELESSCLTAWLCVFRASSNGWSINRFLEAAGGLGPTLLVVRDTSGAVYGCYAPESWSQHGDFYGEEGLKAFVFQLAPRVGLYRASGHTNAVQWCCRRSDFLPNGVGIGGIQRAQALYLSDDLSSGHSRATVAFTNPPMAPAAAGGHGGGGGGSEAEGGFEVAEVECWALDPEAVTARAEAAPVTGDASVLEAHQKELAFLGITGRTAYSAGFREEVPEEYKKQLRV
eukprot:jgi/Ulvmu1/11684/UM008_0094.1